MTSSPLSLSSTAVLGLMSPKGAGIDSHFSGVIKLYMRRRFSCCTSSPPPCLLEAGALVPQVTPCLRGPNREPGPWPRGHYPGLPPSHPFQPGQGPHLQSLRVCRSEKSLGWKGTQTTDSPNLLLWRRPLQPGEGEVLPRRDGRGHRVGSCNEDRLGAEGPVLPLCLFA